MADIDVTYQTQDANGNPLVYKTRLKDQGGGIYAPQVNSVSKGYSSGPISVARPNDTTLYAANDVLGPAGGVSAALVFPTMGPAAGGEIMITSAVLERDVTALIAGETSYLLHLYNVTPPSVLADNAPFDLSSAGDRAAYLGSINLGTPVDLGSTLYVGTEGINKQITLLSGSLYGYLVTVGTYTPVALTVSKVTLHAVAV